MTARPDADWMAEAIERARFENLRQGVWEELRPTERSTRVGMLRDAMVRSGVAGEIDALRSQADRTGLLLDLIDQRERETEKVRSRHESEVARLAHEVASLRARVGELSAGTAGSGSRALHPAAPLADGR